MTTKKRARIRLYSPDYAAYHEAGHVVVGLMLDRDGESQLVSVDIRSDVKKGRGGITRWTHPIGLSDMGLFHNIAMSFGGLEAIRLIRKRRPSLDDYLLCVWDWEGAKKDLIELGEDNFVFRLRHPPDQIAATILRKNRVLLDAIAEALVAKQKLSGHEVNEIYNRVMTDDLWEAQKNGQYRRIVYCPPRSATKRYKDWLYTIRQCCSVTIDSR